MGLGPIAQLVEQRPFKPRVPGSSPGGPSTNEAEFYARLFSWPRKPEKMSVSELGFGVAKVLFMISQLRHFYDLRHLLMFVF